MKIFQRLFMEEEGVALVEEAILVGLMGFAFYFFWMRNLDALVRSYNRVWGIVHGAQFP